jgi:hypothetical protein
VKKGFVTISHKIIEVFYKTKLEIEKLPVLTKQIMQEFIQKEKITDLFKVTKLPNF